MGDARTTKRGFTLIELLLVIVMIGLVTAIVIPSFVESIRSHRIKNSIKYIRVLNNYARSTAILTKRDIRIYYDVFGHEIRLNVEEQSVSGNVTEQFFANSGLMSDALPPETLAEEPDYDEEGRVIVKSASLDNERKSRKLERNVAITDFLGLERKTDDNGFWVHYYPSGMCDTHRVILTDDRGEGDVIEAIIDIEGITGHMKVEIIE